MNFLAWNAQRLGSPESFLSFEAFQKGLSTCVGFLCKTRLHIRCARGYGACMGLPNFNPLDSRGLSGGLLIFWHYDSHVDIHSFSIWHIDSIKPTLSVGCGVLPGSPVTLPVTSDISCGVFSDVFETSQTSLDAVLATSVNSLTTMIKSKARPGLGQVWWISEFVSAIAGFKTFLSPMSV